MKIIKWETVGQKLVKFKMAIFELCKTRTKNTVFCVLSRKIRCFSNYSNNHTATQIFPGNLKYPLKGKIPHPLSSFPIFSFSSKFQLPVPFLSSHFSFLLSPFQSMGSNLWLGENTKGFGEIFFSFLLFLFSYLSIKFVAKN